MSDFPARAANKFKRIVIENTAGIRGAVPAAVIGAGGISPAHLSGYLESVSAYPAAICDINPAAIAARLAKYKGLKGYLCLEDMLTAIAPKIISVCTWPQDHLAVVERTLTSDVRGILCEKPLTLRLDEAKRMARLCEQRGVKLGGAHQYRFFDVFQFAAEAVRSGKLGKIRKVKGCIASSLANNGPHLIDTIRFVLGDRPITHVACHCEREEGLVSRNYPAEQASTGTIKFEGGLLAEIVTGEKAESFFEIQILGDGGQITISPSSGVSGSIKPTKLNKDRKHARPKMFKEFVAWSMGKKESFSADSTSSVATVEAVLAMYEAARTGGEVAIPLANEGDVIRQLYPDEIVATQTLSVLDALEPAARLKLAANGGQPAMTLPVSSNPIFGTAEVLSLTKVIRSGRLGATGGTEVRGFEKDMTRMYGALDAVASTSGTAALHVALAAINPEPGDEVITTPVTDMGSIIPIIACNCLPVFADVDDVTGNLTAESIEEKITPKTKAVILVHLFGRPADVKSIRDLLGVKGIALIEDCAQAHYADTPLGKVGSIGDLGCFSLQQSKQITCGDGGVTLINNPKYLERAKLFVDKGWNRKAGRAHEFFGMNYRMTELQATVARRQLDRLPRQIESRRATASRLRQRISGIPGILVPQECEGSQSSWWIFHWIIRPDFYRLSPEIICGFLVAEGVKARLGYLPRPIFDEQVLTEQLTYGTSGYPLRQFEYRPPNVKDYPGTEQVLNNAILIGWGPKVSMNAVDQMGDAILKVFAAVRRK